jgi:hypothetical protein
MWVGFGGGRFGCGVGCEGWRFAGGIFVFGLGVVRCFGFSKDGVEEGVLRIGWIAVDGGLKKVGLGIIRAPEGPSFILNEVCGGGASPLCGPVFGARDGKVENMDRCGSCHGRGVTI